MILGCITTWNDPLTEAALESLLPAVDTAVVIDGPIGPSPAASPGWRPPKRLESRVVVKRGGFLSDAAKRSAYVAFSRAFEPPVWGVIVDSDELLANGAGVRDMIRLAEALEQRDGRTRFAVPLRIMEADGVVSMLNARILRLDLVERYLISSYHLLMRSGVEVSLGNELGVWRPWEPVNDNHRRPPFGLEPYVYHRTFLRDPGRGGERQHRAEGRELERLIAEQGLSGAPAPRDDRPALWLPESGCWTD